MKLFCLVKQLVTDSSRQAPCFARHPGDVPDKLVGLTSAVLYVCYKKKNKKKTHKPYKQHYLKPALQHCTNISIWISLQIISPCKTKPVVVQ